VATQLHMNLPKAKAALFAINQPWIQIGKEEENVAIDYRFAFGFWRRWRILWP
jgi:hypothetical protein